MLCDVVAALAVLGVCHSETLKVVCYHGRTHLWLLSPLQTATLLRDLTTLGFVGVGHEDVPEAAAFAVAAAVKLRCCASVVEPEVMAQVRDVVAAKTSSGWEIPHHVMPPAVLAGMP